MEEPAGITPTADDIRQWIVNRVAHLTNLPATEVDAHAPLTRYGLDSVVLIALAADCEKWLGFKFRDNPLADDPTIEALARSLADLVAKQKGAG